MTQPGGVVIEASNDSKSDSEGFMPNEVVQFHSLIRPEDASNQPRWSPICPLVSDEKLESCSRSSWAVPGRWTTVTSSMATPSHPEEAKPPYPVWWFVVTWNMNSTLEALA